MAALLIAASISAVATASPVAAAVIDTGATYQLVNRASGKTLDVYEASTADGARITQWSAGAAPSANQQWRFVPAGVDSYKLTATHSGKIASVSGASTADGAELVQWRDDGNTNQQWSVIDTSDGYVKLINRHSGKVLDVNGGSTADGARLQQWTDYGSANQQWRLVPVGAPPAADRGLHVDGRYLVDGNGERVVFRAVEHILRWGNYSGTAPIGDVPWEGGANDSTGSQLDEIVKTGTNAVRLFGGLPQELDSVLHKAVVQHKLWVSVGRVNWQNPTVVSTLKKYGRYLTLHVRGEFQSDDEDAWRRAAISDITQIRALGLTSPIEVQPVGYGQRLGAILRHGDAIMAADPLRSVVFSYQLYSELAHDVSGSLDSTAAYQHPVWVGTCLFQGGIDHGYGNTPNTYKEVWDGSGSRRLTSLVWSWSGDGEGNNMSTNGRYDSLTAVGQYIVNQSPYSLKKYAPKTAYLLGAHV